MKVSEMYNEWKTNYDNYKSRIIDILIDDLISILEEKYDDYEFCSHKKVVKLSYTNSSIMDIETKLGKCSIIYRGSDVFVKESPSSLTLYLDGDCGISQDLSLNPDDTNPKMGSLVGLLEKYWENIKKIEHMNQQQYVYRSMNKFLWKRKAEEEIKNATNV